LNAARSGSTIALMARELVKNAKGKPIGSIEDRGKEILAFDEKGKPRARFDRQQNVTFDAGGNELGKGNQLIAILQKDAQGTSVTAKSSFTAQSAAAKANLGGGPKPGQKVDYNSVRPPNVKK
jgi:hypothetical protein